MSGLVTSRRISTGASLSQPVDALDRAFVVLVACVASISWVAMTLAWLGQFRLVPLVGASLVLMATATVAIGRSVRGLPGTVRSVAPHLAGLLAVLACGAVLFLHPVRVVFDGSDGSVYVAISEMLRTGGTTTPHDPLVAVIDPSDRAAIFRPTGSGYLERFPGGVSATNDGVIHPGFFHLFPAWMAVAGLLLGPGARWFVNPAFALGSIVALWMLARRTSGPAAAPIAAALLAVNVAQVWFARFPSSEVLAQFLVLSAAALVALAAGTGWAAPAVVAGAAFGAVAFARVDTLLLVTPAALAVLAFAVLRGGTTRTLACAGVLGALITAQAVAYGATVAAPYTLDVAELLRRYAARSPGNVVLLGTAVAAGAVTAVLAIRRRTAPRVVVLGVTVLAVGVLAFFLWKDSSRGGFLRLVSVPGAIVGVAGIALLLADRGIVAAGVVALLFAASTVYLRAPLDDYAMPWMLRRYVPVLLPLTMLGVAHAVTRVERSRWRRVVTIGAPLLLGAWFGSRTWSLVAGPDIRTGEDQLARLAVMTPPSALLVWDARTPSHAALAAQYAFGRGSLLVHPASPAAGAVRQLVSRVGAQTPVRLVVDGRDGTSGQEWRRSLPDVEMTPAGELPLRYDRAVSRGRTARWSIAPVDRLLQIYVLQPTSHAAPVALPVRVDVGTADLPYLVDGFHDAEDSNGRSCRWTRGTARLRLPPNAAPAGTPLRATLELAAARPAGVTATLDLFWNGRHAASLRPGAGFDTYVVALGAWSGGPDELALRSDAFVPSRTGGGTDDRALGVLVDVITVDRVP